MFRLYLLLCIMFVHSSVYYCVLFDMYSYSLPCKWELNLNGTYLMKWRLHMICISEYNRNIFTVSWDSYLNWNISYYLKKKCYAGTVYCQRRCLLLVKTRLKLAVRLNPKVKARKSKTTHVLKIITLFLCRVQGNCWKSSVGSSLMSNTFHIAHIWPIVHKNVLLSASLTFFCKYLLGSAWGNTRQSRC